MSYYDEFVVNLRNHDFPTSKRLWEEYCTCDTVDPYELKNIVIAIKESKLAEPFGECIEWILPLWQTLDDKQLSYDVLRIILDLQTVNSEELADITFATLQQCYGDHAYFSEKIRLIGLRQRVQFQGAVANYELLSHMDKSKFVYHVGGWGVGEIVELSLVREQLVIEFEHVTGKKDISFQNAFKSLVPIPDTHFLSQRFGFPDQLEKEAKNNPVLVIQILLRDLGPKTAAELKEELCELVIPQADWPKWWQNTRSKMKQNTMIKMPRTLRDCFELRKLEQTHEERLIRLLANEDNPSTIQATIYKFLRDFTETLANKEVADLVQEKLSDMLTKETSQGLHVSALILLFDIFNEQDLHQRLIDTVLASSDYSALIDSISILAFKKRVLHIIRNNCSKWNTIFANLLFYVNPNQLKEFLLKEWSSGDDTYYDTLQEKVQALKHNPIDFPRTFVWYFQKITGKGNASYPLHDIQSQRFFLESFLILLDYIEQTSEYRDLMKKMHTILTGKRFAIVRSIIKGADVSFLQEFLLLTSKCHSIDAHNAKIIHSLAEAANPELAKMSSPVQEEKEHADEIIWTTQEGFNKTKDRIQYIANVEIISNAKEIESARALGDLRENAEYKFALEKRSRLQAELGMLTNQLNRARIISQNDIPKDFVSVGIVVNVKTNGEKVKAYTILGPWDASPENNILSAQSKLAQALQGGKVGDTISFRDQKLTILSLNSYLDK